MNAKLDKLLTLFGEIESLKTRLTNLEEENKHLKEAANLTEQDITGLKTTQVYLGANMDKNAEVFHSLEKDENKNSTTLINSKRKCHKL